jgi:hypothetical protein
MTDRTAHLRLGLDGGAVEVAGHDLSRSTTALRLEHRPGHRPLLRLELLLDQAHVEGEVQVVVPDETAAALVALGWTPPGEQPSAGWLEGVLRSREHRAAVEAEVRRLARIDQSWGREAMGHQCRSKT